MLVSTPTINENRGTFAADGFRDLPFAIRNFQRSFHAPLAHQQ